MSVVNVGGRFAEERERLGYTQVAFARLLGLSVPGLRKIEAGQSEFKVNVLTAAASAGVDVQYVVTGVRSKNTEKVTDKIGFEKQVIEGNVSGIGFVGDGANVTINHNPRTTIKAETKPGEEHISLPQRSILHKLVDDVVEKEALLKKQPKTHRAVWAALNRHCGVNTYTLIAHTDFEKARKYLHMWLGRLNAAPSASVKDGEAWRKSRYQYIKINAKNPDDAQALSAYIARKYKATSIKDLSNDELEETYRYVAGRRNRSRK